MNLWTEIRQRVLTGELSKRGACREYHIHWDTLQKILTHEEPPGYRRRNKRPSKLDPFLPIIHQILEEDKQAPRKQRHTGERIFERLRTEHGYSGGKTIVLDAIRAWRCNAKEVFLPLEHPPGQAQVDFGFAEVVLAGTPTKLALFVLTLPYSDGVYIQAFPRECTEAFLEGHKRAFAFFGGVPHQIAYDNSKIAVAKILGYRDREVTREFLRLKSHYLFRDHFCLVRRPNEKGHVERLLDYGRRRFLVPVPVVDTLDQLNEYLQTQCREDLDRHLRGQSGSKRDLLPEDQRAFLPLPKRPFEARRLSQAKADSLSLVRFDRNSYSVPTQYAHRPITIVATITDVRLIFDHRLIARHDRDWGTEQYHFNPLHYLALLERKPHGLDFARPFAQWDLPVCFGVYRRRLEAQDPKHGTREFIKVLRLLERHQIQAVERAVQQALEIDVMGADAVRVLLEFHQEPVVSLFSLAGRPHLGHVGIATTDVSAYQSLLNGEAHEPQRNEESGVIASSPQDPEALDDAAGL